MFRRGHHAAPAPHNIMIAGSLFAALSIQHACLAARTCHHIVMEADAPPRFLSKGSIWPGSRTTVREHMTTRLITIPPDMLLKEAALMMNEERITGAPVCEDGRLIGIVSRSDFLRMIATVPPECEEDLDSEECLESDAEKQLVNVETTEVRNVMHKSVTILPDATILQAAQLMHPRRLNRLMVTDEAGTLLGIITSTDIIRVGLCDEVSEVNYGDDDDDK